ncbi:MAG: AmmeMemoRadiSam system radical SAM enzyme [Calditrichaceae bacterium]|nr:AmmeMemoRadiSam system radical SAM enzyme [Calditrichaceae bacterium]
MGLFYPAFSKNDDFPESTKKFVREAQYYEKLDHKQIRCKLCPRECIVDDRERGYCGVRENRNGIYYTLVYARPCTYHVDPIEKKPLFHFLPGTMAFSLATAGCNLNCKFCQNWQISQVTPEQVQSIYAPPEKIADFSKKYNCHSIAYTYSEPTIFYEYMNDTIDAGHQEGIKSVVITAAYISQKPLLNLCNKADAIKVDLKAFSESYYKDVVNGELKPVLDSLITMKSQNIWTEIVYLVVPTLNDSDKEIKELCKWIIQYLGKDVPIHFTRYHPQYLLKDLPPTPIKTLERIHEIARSEGIHYSYIGNVPGHPAENTYCHKCNKKIVERSGFTINSILIKDGKCAYCGTKIPGIWQ